MKEPTDIGQRAFDDAGKLADHVQLELLAAPQLHREHDVDDGLWCRERGG
ncbi:hypothetical protein Q2941_28800 [Bradyrhizobium sp. UFLA05-153]